jgi:hypothetical protein
MAAIGDDNVRMTVGYGECSHDDKDTVLQMPWLKDGPITADMYVDLSECGGCEPLHEGYGVTWTKWLLGKNETAYDMYERCRRIDDTPDDCAE